MELKKNVKNPMDRKGIGKKVEVLRRINTQKSIWNTLRLRRKPRIGHLIRNSVLR